MLQRRNQHFNLRGGGVSFPKFSDALFVDIPVSQSVVSLHQQPKTPVGAFQTSLNITERHLSGCLKLTRPCASFVLCSAYQYSDWHS